MIVLDVGVVVMMPLVMIVMLNVGVLVMMPLVMIVMLNVGVIVMMFLVMIVMLNVGVIVMMFLVMIVMLTVGVIVMMFLLMHPILSDSDGGRQKPFQSICFKHKRGVHIVLGVAFVSHPSVPLHHATSTHHHSINQQCSCKFCI